jgi:hypothetical protein
VLGEQVGGFTLAFIAPLGSHNHNRRHGYLYSSKGMRCQKRAPYKFSRSHPSAGMPFRRRS